MVSVATLTPLLRRNAAICWPLASLTMWARVRLRKARLRAIAGTLSLPPKVLGGRSASGWVSRESIRMAWLSPSGAESAGLPAAGKSYIRRQSAIQLLISRRSPPRSPPRAEKMNM